MHLRLILLVKESLVASRVLELQEQRLEAKVSLVELLRQRKKQLQRESRLLEPEPKLQNQRLISWMVC